MYFGQLRKNRIDIGGKEMRRSGYKAVARIQYHININKQLTHREIPDGILDANSQVRRILYGNLG